MGSSPLARGARYYIAAINEQNRIIPARAGSTADIESLEAYPSDHPRSRGEHLGIDPDAQLKTGSSPLARGAP